MKEIRAVLGRQERGKFKEDVEIHPSCSECNREAPGLMRYAKERRVVRGVACEDRLIYCLDHALARFKALHPAMTDEDFEKCLKPFAIKGVLQLYWYEPPGDGDQP